MSAFMCSDRHINALVTFASLARMSYYWQGKHYDVKGNEQRTALVLQAANARSVNYRYAHNTDAQCDDEPIRYRITDPHSTAVVILKQCRCFDYQASEPDDYEQSEAQAITRAIVSQAISKLPGYDAAPWGLD